jgi:hypothetical protein
MSKLKYSLVLPIVQFPIALTLVLWYYILSERQAAPILLFRPAVSFFCRGMNAPAWLIGGLISEVTRFLILFAASSRSDWSSPSNYRIPFSEMFFLASVLVLWFLVGRAIDQNRLAQPPVGKKIRRGEILLNIFLLLLGLF